MSRPLVLLSLLLLMPSIRRASAGEVRDQGSTFDFTMGPSMIGIAGPANSPMGYTAGVVSGIAFDLHISRHLGRTLQLGYDGLYNFGSPALGNSSVAAMSHCASLQWSPLSYLWFRGGLGLAWLNASQSDVNGNNISAVSEFGLATSATIGLDLAHADVSDPTQKVRVGFSIELTASEMFLPDATTSVAMLGFGTPITAF